MTTISQKPASPRIGWAATAIAVGPAAMMSGTLMVPNTPRDTDTYTAVASPIAIAIARGSWRGGSARSLAVNVTTPKPRKAKNVRATLDTMSRMLG